jgi:hypothetical protein
LENVDGLMGKGRLQFLRVLIRPDIHLAELVGAEQINGILSGQNCEASALFGGTVYFALLELAVEILVSKNFIRDDHHGMSISIEVER